MKPKPYKVACLGNVLVDVLVKPVSALPRLGELLPVDRIEIAMGGCASNTAIALSRLGVPAALWGKLGRDFFGDYAIKNLQETGVDISSARRDPKVSTSATLVLVNAKGQRSFLHALAANDHIVRKDLPLNCMGGFQHLHVGGYFLFPGLDGRPMAEVLRQARSRGLATSLDTAWDLKNRWLKALAPCLPHLDYFMPSEREVKKLLGHCRLREAGRYFSARGVGCTVIKLGEKGAYLQTRSGGEILAPAFKARVVDTTGAGDCFCAGFIKGLSQGRDLGECLKLANAAGACAVESLGATTGIRSFQQILKRHKKKI
jgi:sugar/nucleoside kinase (ribokinase family)